MLTRGPECGISEKHESIFRLTIIRPGTCFNRLHVKMRVVGGRESSYTEKAICN